MAYKNGGTIVLTLVDLLFFKSCNILSNSSIHYTPNFIYVNFIFNNIYPQQTILYLYSKTKILHLTIIYHFLSKEFQSFLKAFNQAPPTYTST